MLIDICISFMKIALTFSSYSSCTLSNVDIYMKFCEDSSNGFQIIEQI